MKVTLLCVVLGVLSGLMACNPNDKSQPSSNAPVTTAGSEPSRDKDHDKGDDMQRRALLPGACSDGWSNCTTNNICTSSPCTVIVANVNGTATATIQGKTPSSGEQPYICINKNTSTQVIWKPAPGTGNTQWFVGDFGTTSPWVSTRTYVAGSNAVPDTEQSVAAPSCSKFDLVVCNTLCTGTNCNLQCGAADPKVIIGGDDMRTQKK